MDHKAEFELLVMKKLGDKVAGSIDWSAPRLLCIASDFTRYDEHAVQQINRNIELIRYRRYGGEHHGLIDDVHLTTEPVPSWWKQHGPPRKWLPRFTLWHGRCRPTGVATDQQVENLALVHSLK